MKFQIRNRVQITALKMIHSIVEFNPLKGFGWITSEEKEQKYEKRRYT